MPVIMTILSDERRAACNQLFADVLGAENQVLPTRAEEAAIRALIPGIPETMALGAYEGATLIGAAYLQASAYWFSRLNPVLGSERALDHVTRWRHLSHLAVALEHRGHGVGRSLVERAQDHARSSGAHGVWGFAEDSPVPSWPFYKAIGFTVAGPGKTLPPLDGVRIGSNDNRRGRAFTKTLQK